MANELNIQLDPFKEHGLTLIARVFNKTGSQQGSDVTMTISTTNLGFYTGNFPLGAINDGDYIVKFQTTTDFYGSGILSVKDGAEVVPSTLTGAEVATELATYDAPTKAELDAAQTSIESNITSSSTLNNVAFTNIQNSIGALNDLSTSDIDASLTAYDAPTKAELDSAVANLSTFDATTDQVITDTASRNASKADVSLLATAASITSLNDLSTSDIDASLTAYDAPTKAELDSAVAGLSTFDPLVDTVANVSLVATVTTNTDMRGTDNALTTIATTNSSLSAIKAKTDLLQFDGTDVKATLDGEKVATDDTSRNASKADVSSLATQTSVDGLFNLSALDIQNALNSYGTAKTSDVQSLNDLSAGDIDARLTAYDGPTKSELDSAVAGLSTFDATTDQVTTDTASRLASQNDLTVIESDVSQVRKRIGNRRKIDTTDNTEVVYDDDKTTPLYTSDLKDADGDATSDAPFEIVPR